MNSGAAPARAANRLAPREHLGKAPREALRLSRWVGGGRASSPRRRSTPRIGRGAPSPSPCGLAPAPAPKVPGFSLSSAQISYPLFAELVYGSSLRTPDHEPKNDRQFPKLKNPRVLADKMSVLRQEDGGKGVDGPGAACNHQQDAQYAGDES